ncbi:MAG: LPS assembly lipoprotein LptE [Pseudomonadota bacterium]
MSWSRRAFVGLAALPLAGCFKPMLAEGGGAMAVRGRIALPEIDTRFSYHLVQSLETRLGRPGATEYRLVIQTALQDEGLAVSQDNDVTRITTTATASWQLYQDGEPEPVLDGLARSQSGYNATSSLFATRQTRRDIERRLARDLGERISRVILARADQLGS